MLVVPYRPYALVSLLLMLLASTMAAAQSPPTVKSVEPAKANPGTYFKAIVRGSDLDNVTAISFGEDIAVRITKQDQTTIEMDVAVFSPAKIGPRGIRLSSGATFIDGPSDKFHIVASDVQRDRWELIPVATSGINGNGTTETGTAPNLTGGTDANFLFRLDYLLDTSTPNSEINGFWKKLGNHSIHAIFETGIVNLPRTVNLRTDPDSSKAVETLGVSAAPTNVGTTLSRERAFTFGADLAANFAKTSNDGKNLEVGSILRGHFDAYFANERFYEKDGITYFKLNDPGGTDSGFWRGEAGIHLRITHNSETVNLSSKDNIEDLLLIEGFYQNASALKSLSADYSANQRWVGRFMAFPLLPSQPDGKKATKLVIGLEVSNDLHHGGHTDVQLFYGINVDIPKLFN